jgi:hypothetical protein
MKRTTVFEAVVTGLILSALCFAFSPKAHAEDFTCGMMVRFVRSAVDARDRGVRETDFLSAFEFAVDANDNLNFHEKEEMKNGLDEVADSIYSNPQVNVHDAVRIWKDSNGCR